jgi:hypothetical protein
MPCQWHPGVQTIGNGVSELFEVSPESQEGAQRSSTATSEHVLQQFVTSLAPNVVTKLVEAVRDSGVKDPIAQPIIDRLVKLGQSLRKASPDRVAHMPDEVQAILTEELKKAYSKGLVMNPLLDMDGKSHGRFASSACQPMINP